MKNKKIWIWIIVVIIIGVLVYYFVVKPKLPPEADEINNQNNQGGGSGSASTTDSNFPLSKGSKGKWVSNTQKNINLANKKRGKTTVIDEDGDFGPATEAALVELGKFLGYNNLKTLDAAHYNGIRNYVLTGSILDKSASNSNSDTTFTDGSRFSI